MVRPRYLLCRYTDPSGLHPMRRQLSTSKHVGGACTLTHLELGFGTFARSPEFDLGRPFVASAMLLSETIDSSELEGGLSGKGLFPNLLDFFHAGTIANPQACQECLLCLEKLRGTGPASVYMGQLWEISGPR